jgi:hypothetical protein
VAKPKTAKKAPSKDPKIENANTNADSAESNDLDSSAAEGKSSPNSSQEQPNKV